MSVSSVFSARNITLFVVILVALLLGSMFNVQVGPESLENMLPLPSPLPLSGNVNAVGVTV